MNYKFLDTPIGTLRLVSRDNRLARIEFENQYQVDPLDCPAEDQALTAASQQLQEYFSGARQSFSIPLSPGGTQFQQSVWSALDRIPFGELRSYSDIAREIGRPRAVRAVGAANGKNPIPIIVPCHRVIGSNGSLTGFAGGLDIKTQLLELEGALLC